MAKNKKFNRVYTITVEGKSTNDHIPNFVFDVLSSIVQALDRQFKQLNISVSTETKE